MTPETSFLIYCLERYRHAKNLTGAQAAELFETYGLYDYIREFFESLHTLGEEAIIQDIDEYIEEKKK